MKIQVLGSGCATCHKLYDITTQAVKELQMNEKVEYVTGDEGIQRIIALGSATSPVLAIDDNIAMTGFTPDVEKIKRVIRQSAS